MPEIISQPSRIPVPGGKVIDEFLGRVAGGVTAGAAQERPGG
jgi:hypothetical protein